MVTNSVVQAWAEAHSSAGQHPAAIHKADTLVTFTKGTLLRAQAVPAVISADTEVQMEDLEFV